MALSSANFPSRVPGDTITVSFPYLSRDYVYVSVDGEVVSSALYSWSNSSTLLCLSGFPAGIGKVYRVTPKAEVASVLTGSTSFDWKGSNKNFAQLLHIEQELEDGEADRNARLEAIKDEVESVGDNVGLARKWASEDEDVVVLGGEYSAKHYAAKAHASEVVLSGADAALDAALAELQATVDSLEVLGLTEDFGLVTEAVGETLDYGTVV